MTSESDAADAPQPVLETHHVFLDTEVYKGLGHNLEGPLMRALAEHLADDRLVLHITDITLSETSRHIREDSERLATDAVAMNKRLARWRARAPETLRNTTLSVDDQAVTAEAVRTFTDALNSWGVNKHDARNQVVGPVLDQYFARKPPFDAADSKEFPDALVISELSNWCRTNDAKMYCVTADKAMQRAAAETGVLLPIGSLAALLQIVAAMDAPEVIQWAETTIQRSALVSELQTRIEQGIGWLGSVYRGDQVNGEVYEVAVEGDVEIEDFSVVSSTDTRLGLLLRVKIPVIAQIQYDDLSYASYDNEDQEYIGAEREDMELEDEQVLRVFVAIDPRSNEIAEFEILTQDMHFAEPQDFDK